MSNYCTAALVLSLFFCRLQADLDHFHVCTVASYEHENLAKLKESCRLHHIDLEVLGMGLPYCGNGTKLVHMAGYLQSLADDEIVLFVDAFDVLIVADKETVLEKFLHMKTSFIMSTELSCSPYTSSAWEYPLSPTRFKYINTGGFIGYVGSIKAWLNALEPINPKKCDQAQATLQYLRGQKFFTLDHQCEIFLSLHSVEDVVIDDVNRVVYLPETGTQPCIVHANGRGWFDIWNEIYERLIRPSNPL